VGILSRISAGLEWVFRVAIGGLLLAATALVFVSVLLRYGFSYGLSWGDELTKYTLLWMVFLGGGIAARQGAHISMEALLTALPRHVQRVNAVAVNAVCAVLSAIVGYLAWGLTMAIRELGQVGAASGLPIFWVYLAIPVGCVLMVLGFWETALRHLREQTAPDEAPKNLATPG
jgi:C4-dicarboxylate transporter DctQ subunit